MVGKSDGAAAAPLRRANGYVLVEGCSALDGRLVDLLVLVDGVAGAVAREGALHSSLASGAAGVAFLHIVFHEWALAPAVDGCEYGTAGAGCGAREGDVSVQRVQ